MTPLHAAIATYSILTCNSATEHLIDASVTAPEVDKLLGNIQQRIVSRVPTAYISGEAILGKYTFKATPAALIPRSCTGSNIVQNSIRCMLKIVAVIAEVLEREESEEMEGNPLSLAYMLKKQRHDVLPEVSSTLTLIR